jgi:hypothetical protein
MRHDLDFSGRIDGLDGDAVAEVSRAVFDLDALGEEFLEGREVEDLVGDGLCAVYGVLYTTASVRNAPYGKLRDRNRSDWWWERGGNFVPS